MSPTIRPGQLIIVTGLFKDVHVGDIIIFVHGGKEKIKRIKHVDPLKGIFVVGDNAHYSTDSRSFGWMDFSEVVGKVVWPRNRTTLQ